MIQEKLIKMIKEKLLLIVMFLFMTTTVFGLSNPINQTFSEYNNLTRADNVLEVAQEINVWVGGLFGVVLLVGVFAVTFTISLFFRNDMGKGLLFSLFITTISSIFLFVAGLVPDSAVFWLVPMFIISIIFVVVKN